jgi:Ser-tRNA(Ala) deacylase AlaX
MEQIDQSKEQFVSSLGGDIEFKRYLKNVGITDEIFDGPFEVIQVPENHAEVFKEGSKYEVLPDQLKSYYDENYHRVKHIMFSIIKSDGTPFPMRKRRKKKPWAEEVLGKIRSVRF